MTDAAPRAMAQEGMFWELVPENVIEIRAERIGTDHVREWRSRKNKIERGREDLGQHLNSPRKVQLREKVLSGFLETFVDDRRLCRDACFWDANVQSQAVLFLCYDDHGRDLLLGG